jgi:hypothetical protein
VAALVPYRSSSRGNCLLSFSCIERSSARGNGDFRMESIRGMYTTICLLNSLHFPPFHLIKFRETGKLLQTEQERSVYSNAKSVSGSLEYQKPNSFSLVLRKRKITLKVSKFSSVLYISICGHTEYSCA